MDASWVSTVPFLVVIAVALLTKQVLPGLILGLITGAYLLQPQWIGGLERAISYIVESLTDTNNLKIIIFLYMFTGLVGLIKLSGGIKGFVDVASKRIDTKKEALILTWLSTLGTFSAPSFRIVTVAPIMKALLNKIKITKSELAFMIETSTQPVIVLIPIATAFVGYMVSVIDLGLQNEGLKKDPYSLYIQSIPFNFFAIIMIIVGTVFAFIKRKKGKGESQTPGKPEDVQEEKENPATAGKLPSRPWNLLIPVVLVIVLTLFLTWRDGARKGYGFFASFIQADVLQAMVLALFITVLVTVVLLLLQGFSLKKMIQEFIDSGNQLMSVILLLAVVWGLSLVSEDLHFSQFVTANVGWIPTAFIPPVIFLLGALVSYFIGSSWGTWGILMPLGISLAAVSNASLPLVIGAVFASGSFGAFASPLSDSTNTIAKILNLDVIQYARFKLLPALISVGLAAILYGIIAFMF